MLDHRGIRRRVREDLHEVRGRHDGLLGADPRLEAVGHESLEEEVLRKRRGFPRGRRDRGAIERVAEEAPGAAGRERERRGELRALGVDPQRGRRVEEVGNEDLGLPRRAPLFVRGRVICETDLGSDPPMESIRFSTSPARRGPAGAFP